MWKAKRWPGQCVRPRSNAKAQAGGKQAKRAPDMAIGERQSAKLEFKTWLREGVGWCRGQVRHLSPGQGHEAVSGPGWIQFVYRFQQFMGRCADMRGLVKVPKAPTPVCESVGWPFAAYPLGVRKQSPRTLCLPWPDLPK